MTGSIRGLGDEAMKKLYLLGFHAGGRAPKAQQQVEDRAGLYRDKGRPAEHRKLRETNS